MKTLRSALLVAIPLLLAACDAPQKISAPMLEDVAGTYTATVAIVDNPCGGPTSGEYPTEVHVEQDGDRLDVVVKGFHATMTGRIEENGRFGVRWSYAGNAGDGTPPAYMTLDGSIDNGVMEAALEFDNGTCVSTWRVDGKKQ